MWNCCCTQYCNDMTETLWVEVFYLKPQICELKYFKLLQVRITQQSYWNAVLRAYTPYETSEKQQILQEKKMKTTQFKNINIRMWVRQLKFVPIRVVSLIYTHWTESEPKALDIQTVQNTTVKTLSTIPGEFLCCLAFTSITHRGFMLSTQENLS